MYILYILIGIIIFILTNIKNCFYISSMYRNEECSEFDDSDTICNDGQGDCINCICEESDDEVFRCVEYARAGGMLPPQVVNLEELGWTNKELYKHFKSFGKNILDYPKQFNISNFGDLEVLPEDMDEINDSKIYVLPPNEYLEDNEVILYSNNFKNVGKMNAPIQEIISRDNLRNSGNSLSNIGFGNSLPGLNHFLLFKNDVLVGRIITGNCLESGSDLSDVEDETEVVTSWPSGQGYTGKILKTIKINFPDYEFCGHPIFQAYTFWYNLINTRNPAYGNMFNYFKHNRNKKDELELIEYDNTQISKVLNVISNEDDIYINLLDKGSSYDIMNIMVYYLQTLDLSEDKLVNLFTDENMNHDFFLFGSMNSSDELLIELLMKNLNSEQILILISNYENDAINNLLNYVPYTYLEALNKLYPDHEKLIEYMSTSKKRKSCSV